MNKKGFTLIELLIVIGIIAILAAAVIVAINPGRQFMQARNSTRWSHMNSVMTAIFSAAVTDQGNFPDCIPLFNGTNNWQSVADLYVCNDDLVATGGFINQLPQDPQVGGVTYTWDGDDVDGEDTVDEFWAGGTFACSASLAYIGSDSECTGYLIGYTNADENRVRIISAAQEAYEIEITQ